VATETRLKHYMELRGVRPAVLAAACNVRQETVERWRDGRNGIPAQQLVPLARVLEVTPHALLGWPESPCDDPKVAA
jgi:transcriptional regulator with XRE-family HTH domain